MIPSETLTLMNHTPKHNRAYVRTHSRFCTIDAMQMRVTTFEGKEKQSLTTLAPHSSEDSGSVAASLRANIHIIKRERSSSTTNLRHRPSFARLSTFAFPVGCEPGFHSLG